MHGSMQNVGASDQPGSPGRKATAGILICGRLPRGLVCRGGCADPPVQHVPGGGRVHQRRHLDGRRAVSSLANFPTPSRYPRSPSDTRYLPSSRPCSLSSVHAIRTLTGPGTAPATALRPSTMPSPPSTRPSDARGRRSSAFDREDSERAGGSSSPRIIVAFRIAVIDSANIQTGSVRATAGRLGWAQQAQIQAVIRPRGRATRPTRQLA